MCQVNTDPMKSLSGYLDVVVPPDILNHPDHNLEEGVSTEGGSIVLVCSATGVPEPKVQWRRETGKDIILRAESRDKQALKSVDGERLTLTNVQRTDMGGYNCIASNGVPPSVSKRFDVHVNFPPTIKAVNQLVGAPVEREVTLECIVEVYPKPLNGWYRNEGNVKLHNGNKYNISEEMINLYTWHLNLTIRHLTKSDFGAYSCSSVNALGKSETRIRLQELRLPPKSTTTPTPHVHTTAKPRRKQQPGHNKGLNEVVRAKETHFSNQMQQENDVFGGGIGVPQSANSGNAGSVVESGNVNGMINGAEERPGQGRAEGVQEPSEASPVPTEPQINPFAWHKIEHDNYEDYLGSDSEYEYLMNVENDDPDPGRIILKWANSNAITNDSSRQMRSAKVDHNEESDQEGDDCTIVDLDNLDESTTKKPHSCSHCDKTYQEQKTLDRHMARQHVDPEVETDYGFRLHQAPHAQLLQSPHGGEERQF
ncbi:GL21154 [Drosophila persimilis]|uniref:GL21154 n=1 Tax=Drosophila persimilis TaxID=7234 RepID=B4GX90_DROPE|nr:GL21154 [Drosophila persimilis]